MSEHDEERDAPSTAAEAEGSIVERMKSPATRSGEPRETGRSASAKEIEGEVLRRGNMAPDVPEPVRPRRRTTGRRRPFTEKAGAAREAQMTRPSDEEGTHTVPQTAFGEHPEAWQTDPREERFAEQAVAACFGLAVVGVLIACVGFFLVPPHGRLGALMNYTLGGGLGVALLATGAGFVLWAKLLLPHDKAVQERGAHHSPEEEELLAEETFLKGAASTGLANRPLLRRSVLAALAALPLPAVVFLRDLGPLPHSRLRHSGWKKGLKLVDPETRLPVKLGDLEIGSVKTVMPEGFKSPEDVALAPTILIRFGPGEIRSKKQRDWGVDNHCAYSKICTHAGCPISLYEQQTHHLLCPCHQSTFDMANDANVIFGPAARRLPQLRITVDQDGYLVAQGDYDQPVGPSFWERG